MRISIILNMRRWRMYEQGKELERVRPQAAGIDPGGIRSFVGLIREKQVALHSFMLLRHGKVAAEGYYKPFDPKQLHSIFSVSKSFTSAAVGIAVGEGRFGLDDRVVELLPEKLSAPPHPYTARMTVRHLLSMTTVHRKSVPTNGPDWVHSFLNTPPNHPPGTVYAYDTTGTHTLCAILQKLTGQSVHDYLAPRLLEPIGIGPIQWETCPMNINKGGSGIKCTTEDMARFGQLYLQKGVWNGLQVLPEGWVEQSTARQVDNSGAKVMLDGKPGYGYQFWRLRKNAYCAFGMAGQFVVVIPDKDAVFVSTANTQFVRDGQQLILDCLWEALYPAIGEERSMYDDEEGADSVDCLQSLKLGLPAGRPDSGIAPAVSARSYALADNPHRIAACRFQFKKENSFIKLHYKDGNIKTLPFGMEEWVRCPSDPLIDGPCGARAVWVDEKTCIIHAHLLEMVQMYMLICCFEEEELVVQLVTAGTVFKEELECHFLGVAQKSGL